MDNVRKYGDVRTSDYYGGGSYCLLLKIKKAMYDMNNKAKATIRVISNGTTYKKNDYWLSVESGVFKLESLEKRTLIKCYLTEDTDYIYLYCGTPEYGYPIIMQILNCSDYSIPHLELMHFQNFVTTRTGIDIATTFPTPYVSTATYTLANSWIEHTASNYSYARIIDDIVHVNLVVKSGTITDYTDVVTGLPSRSSNEPSLLLYPACYKEGTNPTYKSCYVRLTRDGKLQILGVADNSMLIIAFSYKREVTW